MMTYQWFLDNGWPIQEDREIIEQWKSSGRQTEDLTQRRLNHYRYRLLFESTRFPTPGKACDELFRTKTADPLPDPIPNTQPRKDALPPLSVRSGSRFFHDPSGRVVDVREATAMGLYRLWLDNRRDRVDELLGYFRDHNINMIRPLFELHSEYWHGKNSESKDRHNTHLEGDHWWGQLVPFIRHIESFGIYTRCCLFGGIEAFVGLPTAPRTDVMTGNPDAIAKARAYVDQFVGTTRDLPSVLYEVANEPSQIGFGYDSDVVKALGKRIKTLAPNRLMNFGAACDEDNTFYCDQPADFFDEHLRRMRDWDYLASCKRLIEHTAVDYATNRMPFISGEWMNLGNITRAGGRLADGTPSTATAFCSAAMLRLKRSIPTFHAHGLLSCDVPDGATDEALVAWSRALDLIPMTFPGRGINGHWTQSPFDKDIFPRTDEGTDAWYGPVRIFGLDGHEGYIGVSIREPRDYNLVGDKRPIQTLHLEQWGDWQSRIVRA
mgnify:FL=1